jgi:glyoxylase-like metal-dependent hydrolase (beta-lactamase superfamily II)
MKTWEIKVLYLGQISANLSLVWTPGLPPLEEDPFVSAPYLSFLLRNGDRHLLVDTGISEKFIFGGKAWGALPAEGGRDFLFQALAKEGLGPEDIDTVIYTHLHNDHAANSKLFVKARVVFQKDEWTNLMCPLPTQTIRMDYDPSVINELRSQRCLRVDGDTDLEDGIRLIKTPGHTLGSQSVVVNTKKGPVVLVGDLCLFNYQMFPGATELVDMEGNPHPIPPATPVFGPAVPPTTTYNAYDFYDSIHKVKAVAGRNEPGYIICGHEPSLVVTGI